ncbi:hypothetical protein ACYSUO_26520 [Streptomyces sp. UC4497]
MKVKWCRWVVKAVARIVSLCSGAHIQERTDEFFGPLAGCLDAVMAQHHPSPGGPTLPEIAACRNHGGRSPHRPVAAAERVGGLPDKPVKPLRVWLNPNHGRPALDVLPFDLVWATTWEEEANAFAALTAWAAGLD